MRTVSNSVRAASNAQTSAAQWFVLIEITHTYGAVSSPIRLTDNPDGASYGGNVYAYFPFRADLPDSKEDGPVHGRLTISAVDQQITAVIRSIEVPATVRAVAVCWPQSGVIEPVASFDLTIRNVSGNVEYITADLIYEERLDNEIPCDTGSPFVFPGAS